MYGNLIFDYVVYFAPTIPVFVALCLTLDFLRMMLFSDR